MDASRVTGGSRRLFVRRSAVTHPAGPGLLEPGGLGTMPGMRLCSAAATALAVAALAGCSGASFTAAAADGGGSDDGAHDTGQGSPDGPAEACVPKLCPQLGWACGVGDDGCGHVVDCGHCVEAHTVCDGVNHACICKGRTCSDARANCGMIDDFCGNTLDCGMCPMTETCGAMTDHVCGMGTCTPHVCVPSQCGMLSNNCGGILDCGGCPPPQTCGGGGVANACGCVAETCAQLGWQCGTGPDGCGGTLTCPDCMTGGCANHSCVACMPMLTCQNQGYKCGSFVDDCAQVQVCGPTPTGALDPLCNGAGLTDLYQCSCDDAGTCSGMGLPGPTPPEPTWMGCTPVMSNTPPWTQWCCPPGLQ
jgi:hypothetical protein